MHAAVRLEQASLVGAIGRPSAVSTFMEAVPVLSEKGLVLRATRYLDGHAEGALLTHSQKEVLTTLGYLSPIDTHAAFHGLLWYMPDKCLRKRARVEELQRVGAGLCPPIPIASGEYLYYVVPEASLWRQKWALEEYEHALDLFFSQDEEGTCKALHNCLELFSTEPPKLVALQGALALRQGQNMDVFWKFMRSKNTEQFVLEVQEDFEELIL